MIQILDQIPSQAAQQQHGESVFPALIEPSGGLVDLGELTNWIGAERERLLQLASKHGAVYFRGFGIASAEDFDLVVRSFDQEPFPYDQSLSNAVRVNRTERVFSANEAPPNVEIFFHHEMAQTPIYPARIFFYCEVAAEQGGATPICRSDVLLEQLSRAEPDFVDRCRRLGLRYTNVMPDANDSESGMGRSWRSTLNAKSREDAERRLAELGYEWEWREDGCLRATTPRLPAVLELSPGRYAFFNQLIAAYCGWKDTRNDPSQAIRYGDGSVLDADAVQVAIQLASELAHDVNWQSGDFALLDNRVTMHARRPFSGTRKVLASLADRQLNSLLPT